MNETELYNLLNQITQEVLRRAEAVRTLNAPETAACAPAVKNPGTVILVPSLVPYQEKAIQELTASYGSSLVFIAFDEHFQADRQRVVFAEKESRKTILRMVSDSIQVVLLAPPMGVIRKIAEAQDDDLLSYLFIRAQLWGKRVSIFLDYELPRYRKSQFQQGISDVLEELTGLGIPMVYYRRDMIEEGTMERSLITEQDVLDAYRSGRRQITCRLDAIITPLAKDKAGELGVEFMTGEVF